MNVNKYQLYRQIREELAAHYQKELRCVESLLQSSVGALVNANNRLDCATTESLVTMGEASKVFREETGEALRLILERYHRSLQKEIEALGLTLEDPAWQQQEACDVRQSGRHVCNGAQRP